MMRARIPTLGPRPKKKKKRLTDLLTFGKKEPPKESKKPERPSMKMPDTGREPSRSTSGDLAAAAAAMPASGTAGRVIKAGLAGASAGSAIQESYGRYKKKRAKARAKKAKTTVTQSAMAQKAKWHKKDKTGTEKP